LQFPTDFEHILPKNGKKPEISLEVFENDTPKMGFCTSQIGSKMGFFHTMSKNGTFWPV
jgi:hypothetical protein